jgi:hypothetical protein
MGISTTQLITELSTAVDATFAQAIVESYVEMQQRFLAGDWKPAELDGGRLCEAVSRALYQLDSGVVTHSELPGTLCDWLEDFNKKRSHNLAEGDRRHLCKAIRLVYKFRSDRGPVHISPIYTANYMDSMLILHVGKWMFAEFLRLAWTADKQVIAETIAQIVQLQHTLIHELDGKPSESSVRPRVCAATKNSDAECGDHKANRQSRDPARGQRRACPDAARSA